MTDRSFGYYLVLTVQDVLPIERIRALCPLCMCLHCRVFLLQEEEAEGRRAVGEAAQEGQVAGDDRVRLERLGRRRRETPHQPGVRLLLPPPSPPPPSGRPCSIRETFQVKTSVHSLADKNWQHAIASFGFSSGEKFRLSNTAFWLNCLFALSTKRMGCLVCRVPTAPGKPGKIGPYLEKQGVLGQKPGKILQNLEKNFDLTLKKPKNLNNI